MPIAVPYCSNLVARLHLSHEENEFYTRLFVNCDRQGCGVIRGDVARELFRASGLPDDVLFEIWGVGDPEDTGELDYGGFCICCRLIAYAQSHGIDCLTQGNECTSSGIRQARLYYKNPRILPHFDVAAVSEELDPEIYTISPEDLEAYSRIFEDLDTNCDGFIEGEEARIFYLSHTDLSPRDLMELWSLADVNMDGRLTLGEFCAMQQLVRIRRETDAPIPKELPKSLHAFIYQSVAPKTAPRILGDTKASAEADNIPLDEISSLENTSFDEKNLLKAVETLTAHLNRAIAGEKESISTLTAERDKLREKLRLESESLDLITSEYRSLRGDGETLILEKSLLEEKLRLIRKQAEDLKRDVSELEMQNSALASSFEKSDDGLANLQDLRQDYKKKIEEEKILLQTEERELNVLKETIQKLSRQKQKLHEEGNSLRECLLNSENSTKAMMRSLEKDQSEIAAIRKERIETLRKRCELIEMYNDNLSAKGGSTLGELRRQVSSKAYQDSKGIRVSKFPALPSGTNSLPIDTKSPDFPRMGG